MQIQPKIRLIFKLLLALGVVGAFPVHAQLEAVVFGMWCSDSSRGSLNLCDAAFRVNLVTGKRTLLSAFTTEDQQDAKKITTTNPDRGAGGWQEVVIAPSGLIFFTSGTGGLITYDVHKELYGLYSINPTTGDRRLVSPFQDVTYGSKLDNPWDISLEITPGGQLLAGQDRDDYSDYGRLFVIDPATGKRTLLSDSSLANQGPSFDDFLGSDPTGRIFAKSYAKGSQFSWIETLSQIDTSTGVRTLVAQAAQENPCEYFSWQALVDVSGQLYCMLEDTNHLGVFNPAVISSATVLSDFGDPNQGSRMYRNDLFSSPSAKWLSAEQILLLDDGNYNKDSLGGLYVIDKNTGVRTLISDFLDAKQGPLIYYAHSMAIGTMPAFVGNIDTGGTVNTPPSTSTESQFGIGVHLSITGEGYGASRGQVKVGKASAKILSWTDTEIKFVLPNVKAGNYRLRGFNKKGKQIFNETLTILAPTLTSLSHTVVNKADILTITGSSLGTVKPKVFFVSGKKKTRATVLKGFNETSVQVKVPKLKAGTYQVLLSNPAGKTNGLLVQVQKQKSCAENLHCANTPFLKFQRKLNFPSTSQDAQP